MNAVNSSLLVTLHFVVGQLNNRVRGLLHSKQFAAIAGLFFVAIAIVAVAFVQPEKAYANSSCGGSSVGMWLVSKNDNGHVTIGYDVKLVGTDVAKLEWGDGKDETINSSGSGNKSHDYSDPFGKKTITLSIRHSSTEKCVCTVKIEFPARPTNTPRPTSTPTQTPVPPTSTFTPEPTQVTQTPEPTVVTQTPEPTQVTQTPEPTVVTQTPEPTQVTQTPEPGCENGVLVEIGAQLNGEPLPDLTIELVLDSGDYWQATTQRDGKRLDGSNRTGWTEVYEITPGTQILSVEWIPAEWWDQELELTDVVVNDEDGKLPTSGEQCTYRIILLSFVMKEVPMSTPSSTPVIPTSTPVLPTSTPSSTPVIPTSTPVLPTSTPSPTEESSSLRAEIQPCPAQCPPPPCATNVPEWIWWLLGALIIALILLVLALTIFVLVRTLRELALVLVIMIRAVGNLIRMLMLGLAFLVLVLVLVPIVLFGWLVLGMAAIVLFVIVLLMLPILFIVLIFVLGFTLGQMGR